jgi:hypothetical protein
VRGETRFAFRERRLVDEKIEVRELAQTEIAVDGGGEEGPPHP